MRGAQYSFLHPKLFSTRASLILTMAAKTSAELRIDTSEVLTQVNRVAS